VLLYGRARPADRRLAITHRRRSPLRVDSDATQSGPCVGIWSRRGEFSSPAVLEIEPLLRQVDAPPTLAEMARMVCVSGP
jgi:hypothetical protein